MNENWIRLAPDLFIRHVRAIKAEIARLVEFRGYEHIWLDFRAVRACFPDAITPIISSVIRYSEEGVYFSIIPPLQENLARTFESSNWCHLIEPEKFKPTDDGRIGRLPARRFVDSATQSQVVNEIIDRVLRVTTFLGRDDLTALEWAINEITDNVLTAIMHRADARPYGQPDNSPSGCAWA